MPIPFDPRGQSHFRWLRRENRDSPHERLPSGRRGTADAGGRELSFPVCQCPPGGFPLDRTAADRYIHISKYENQSRTAADEKDFPGTLGPDPVADTQSAPGRRGVRLPPRRRAGGAAADGLPAPGVSSQGRAGGGQEGRPVDALPPGAGPQQVPARCCWRAWPSVSRKKAGSPRTTSGSALPIRPGVAAA